MTKEKLHKLYWEDYLSTEKIAKIFKVQSAKVKYLMTKYGIKRRSLKQARANVPFGPAQSGWKRGFSISNGYAHRWIDGKFKAVHRILMEDKLGRKLTRWENVHHINGNKLDNRIENLEVVDHGLHASMHMKQIWQERRQNSLLPG